MKIDKKFNQMTLKECINCIENRGKYTDFNTLGLYRSIVENENLTQSEKIELRDHAHTIFQKTFDFLQIKDPKTYIDVCTLGETLTKADEKQWFENVRTYQQRQLKEKKISHRNFGIYSIHDCGYETCPYNGIMIHRGSRLAESNMHFEADKNKWGAVVKSERLKQQRKNENNIVRKELDEID